MPLSVGVPEMLITLFAQLALTPLGKPNAVPMPVAPPVECVSALRTELTHDLGVDEAILTVLLFTMVILPVAFKLLQEPNTGME
jgi:uncharacterized membrane protein